MTTATAQPTLPNYSLGLHRISCLWADGDGSTPGAWMRQSSTVFRRNSIHLALLLGSPRPNGQRCRDV